jgi:hypothetical protein
MERKERNAEGKTSACQIASFISAMLKINLIYGAIWGLYILDVSVVSDMFYEI